MTIWEQHDLTTKVVEVLHGVHCNNDQHHFGRPYITAYQLAIELQRVHPETADAIGKPLGGSGVGQHNSLAQYLSRTSSHGGSRRRAQISRWKVRSSRTRMRGR